MVAAPAREPPPARQTQAPEQIGSLRSAVHGHGASSLATALRLRFSADGMISLSRLRCPSNLAASPLHARRLADTHCRTWHSDTQQAASPSCTHARAARAEDTRFANAPAFVCAEAQGGAQEGRRGSGHPSRPDSKRPVSGLLRSPHGHVAVVPVAGETSRKITGIRRKRENSVQEETVIRGPLRVSFYSGRVSLCSENAILLGMTNDTHKPSLKDLPINPAVKDN